MKNPLRKPLAAYRLRRDFARLERLADRLEASGHPDAATSERERSWTLWTYAYILREPVTTVVDQQMYLSHYGHGDTLSRGRA